MAGGDEERPEVIGVSPDAEAEAKPSLTGLVTGPVEDEEADAAANAGGEPVDDDEVEGPNPA